MQAVDLKQAHCHNADTTADHCADDKKEQFAHTYASFQRIKISPSVCGGDDQIKGFRGYP